MCVVAFHKMIQHKSVGVETPVIFVRRFAGETVPEMAVSVGLIKSTVTVPPSPTNVDIVTAESNDELTFPVLFRRHSGLCPFVIVQRFEVFEFSTIIAIPTRYWHL